MLTVVRMVLKILILYIKVQFLNHNWKLKIYFFNYKHFWTTLCSEDRNFLNYLLHCKSFFMSFCNFIIFYILNSCLIHFSFNTNYDKYLEGVMITIESLKIFDTNKMSTKSLFFAIMKAFAKNMKLKLFYFCLKKNYID